MTEDEARQYLRALGWSYLARQRGGKEYIYAARHVKGRRLERYICTKDDLPDKTRDDIVRLLSVDS